MFKFYFYLLLTLIFSISCSPFGDIKQASQVAEVVVEVITEEPEPVQQKVKGPKSDLIKMIVKKESVEDIEVAIQNGSDLENRNDFHQNTVLMRAILKKREGVSELLIESGADINARNLYEDTPLIVSILKKREGISKLLIEAGADIHARNEGGYTPLMLAAQKKQVETVKLLLAYGADVDAVDNLGDSVMSHAKRAIGFSKPKKIMKILRDAGAKGYDDGYHNNDNDYRNRK
ncbi:MAG: ankyrin repeat domain-containing protein [Bdellovibrionales bacterium]